MKKIKYYLGTLLAFTILMSFNLSKEISKKDELKKELIGTWEFVKMIDNQGIQIDTIWHSKGYQLANGPLLTYNEDGTYAKQFTPDKTDRGTWTYDKRKKAILQKLIYQKPYGFASKYLIDNGHAKKDKNGDYYEVITDFIDKLTETELIVFGRGNQKLIYKKRE